MADLRPVGILKQLATDVCNRNSRKILKKKWTFWSFVKKHFHAPQVMLVSAKVFGAIVCIWTELWCVLLPCALKAAASDDV